jgi:small subunit ribosomal protein S17
MKEKTAKIEGKMKKEINAASAMTPDRKEKYSLRGRKFEGYVIKKFDKRVVIMFERVNYIKKYERYAKTRSKLHARLPENLKNIINVGDYIQIMECRPLSKIIHFIVIKKIRDAKVKQGELLTKDHKEIEKKTKEAVE